MERGVGARIAGEEAACLCGPSTLEECRAEAVQTDGDPERQRGDGIGKRGAGKPAALVCGARGDERGKGGGGQLPFPVGRRHDRESGDDESPVAADREREEGEHEREPDGAELREGFEVDGVGVRRRRKAELVDRVPRPGSGAAAGERVVAPLVPGDPPQLGPSVARDRDEPMGIARVRLGRREAGRERPREEDGEQRKRERDRDPARRGSVRAASRAIPARRAPRENVNTAARTQTIPGSHRRASRTPLTATRPSPFA